MNLPFAGPARFGVNHRLTPRFAACAPGLASGLAPADRPAGAVEAPGSTARRRRVPRSGMRSTVEAGGADPDNARHSVPAAVTFLASAQLVRGRRPGPRGRARHRVDATGTACGRSPRPPGAAARRAAGLPPEGRDESCRTANGASPDLAPAAYGGATLAAHPSPISRARFSRFTSRPSGPARRRCALEAVKKVVTAATDMTDMTGAIWS